MTLYVQSFKFLPCPIVCENMTFILNFITLCQNLLLYCIAKIIKMIFLMNESTMRQLKSHVLEFLCLHKIKKKSRLCKLIRRLKSRNLFYQTAECHSHQGHINHINKSSYHTNRIHR